VAAFAFFRNSSLFFASLRALVATAEILWTSYCDRTSLNLPRTFRLFVIASFFRNPLREIPDPSLVIILSEKISLIE
jgi:hypothetical protein